MTPPETAARHDLERRKKLKANAALALAGCLWGTGFLFGKIAFREMTVSENVSFRFIFAAIPLIPFMLGRRAFRAVLRMGGTRDFWMFVAAAVIGFPVQFLIQFKGLQLTTVSHASLIVGTLPVLVALTSVLFLREHLSALEWGVLVLSPVGALVIAMSARNTPSATGPTLAGDVLIICSMCAAAIMILFSKRLMERYDPIEVTAWMIAIGTVMLLVLADARHGLRFHFSTGVWGAAAAQGFLATAGAYLCWNWGLAHVPASRAGVFLNLEPVVGACLGVAILRETLGAMALLGGAMILGPAIYFSRKG